MSDFRLWWLAERTRVSLLCYLNYQILPIKHVKCDIFPTTTSVLRKISMSQKKTNRSRTHQSNLTNFATLIAKSKLTASNEAMEAKAAADACAGTKKHLEGANTNAAEKSSASLSSSFSINNEV